MSQTENKIFVIYVGIAGVRSEDVEDFVKKITSKIIPTSVKGEFIIIPTNFFETRIECINPVYITETSLIEKHTNLMKQLQEELNYQLEDIRKEKNEEN